MAELINNTDLIMKKIQEACENAMNEIGITGTAELQSNAPVRYGFLRRSITFKKANTSSKCNITFGSSIEYAPYTEFRGKSKGWMRGTMQGLSSESIEILKKHLRKVGK
ncbi:HK97 gp10 family phage protein [uncultured Clostridium sp.]|jgi:hypothetical protein|uniref:HK97 gp10 family phage protein n=1 Tax=uncultured Clostridium sp. TaxID=59620 RepID=UPI002060A3B7|nr:HK97 gp10 family phage protein [uncultured Clostridium sp.]DAV65672.1 MAG TPA: putative tail component [Caudoviricetes sp.]